MTKQLPYTEGISFFSVVAGRPSLFLLQANEDKTGMDFMHDLCEAYMSPEVIITGLCCLCIFMQ